jgi:uncharacterized membrane protein HdeD (DUF308 family)
MEPMTQTNNEAAEASQIVFEKRGWFIALGTILILIGVVAIVSPMLATFSTAIFIGWILIIGGIAQIIHAFWAKGWDGFFWEIFIGLLQLLAGIILLTYPVASVIALTIFLAITFIVEGIMRAVMAFSLNPQSGWVWVLISGVVSIIVGIMLWIELPGSSLWAIGILVGVNIFMAGWSLLMLAFAAKEASNANA